MFSSIRKNYEFHKKNFYRGNDIYCPFCSGTYKAQKFKFTKELSELCPVCGSTLQERTVLLFLQAKTEILPGEPKILVVSEEGKIPEYFRNFPNAEVKIYTETGDFTIRDNTLKDKYESSSYDLIVCNYILEKLPNYIPVLKEFARILKDDGIMLLQANIDNSKETTAEFPVASYKERLLLYGIPGNHRRFGKDYQSLIKSNGLKVSKLKFTEGFDELPPHSFNKDEVFYIAYKSEHPVLFDNMDDLEAEMSEQRSNVEAKWYGRYVYYIFFQVPEKVKGSINDYLGSVDERSADKSSWRYFIYMLFMATISTIVGTAVYSFPLLVSFPGNNFVFLFISMPAFLFCLALAFLCTGGYFFVNYEAGIIRRTLMGLYAATLLMTSMSFAIMIWKWSIMTIVNSGM
jgi:SAM-dependent methyltransferase